MSNWREVQEVNSVINTNRSEIRSLVEFLKQQKLNEDNDQEFIEYAISTCEAMGNILGDSYLDSGYSYDSADPRNLMDMYDDNFEHRKSARNGTSKEAEMRSEIQRQVVSNNYNDLDAQLQEKLEEYQAWSEAMWDLRCEMQSWDDRGDDDHSW